MISEIRITLCDVMNPSVGYSIRIVDDRGTTVLWTAVDPATGKDLKTLADALRVAEGYQS